jgi:hypothetical protein
MLIPGCMRRGKADTQGRMYHSAFFIQDTYLLLDPFINLETHPGNMSGTPLTSNLHET